VMSIHYQKNSCIKIIFVTTIFGGLNVLMPKDLNLNRDLCTSKHGEMDKMNCN
jgi:hypothetical protein